MGAWCLDNSGNEYEANCSLPSSAGPKTIPARISPTTFGWRILTNKYPSSWARATRSNSRRRMDVRSEFDTDFDAAKLPSVVSKREGEHVGWTMGLVEVLWLNCG